MNSLVSKFVTVWIHPWQAMENVKKQGYQENPEATGVVGSLSNLLSNIKSSLLFVFLMGVLSGAITLIYSIAMPATLPPHTTKTMIVVAALVVPVLSSFIGAFFVWAIINGILKGCMSEYGSTYHLLAVVSAFSPVSALLSNIPGTLFLGVTVGNVLTILLNIWVAVVVVGGVIIVRQTPFWRTIVWFTLIFGFLLITGVALRGAAQREMQRGSGFNDFGAADFGGATDDLGATSDELEKQLQELSEKAKEAPKK